MSPYPAKFPHLQLNDLEGLMRVDDEGDLGSVHVPHVHDWALHQVDGPVVAALLVFRLETK